MVIDYLKKIQEENLTKKVIVEKKINELQVFLKENMEFEKLLEETNDSSYELFTPREVNVKNKIKLQEIKEEKKHIEENIELLKIEYQEYVDRLDEISVVIDTALSNNESCNESRNFETSFKKDEKEYRKMVSEDAQDFMPGLNHILHNMELCFKIIDVDPIRTKLELQGIISELKNIIRQDNKEDDACL